jgi:hypothetical protein
MYLLHLNHGGRRIIYGRRGTARFSYECWCRGESHTPIRIKLKISISGSIGEVANAGSFGRILK